MRSKYVYFGRLVLLACALAGLSAQGQTQTQVTLRQLTRPAGFIFAGRVLRVQYLPATTSSQVPSMRITFLVEQGLKGVRTGKTFTMRQWAGAWDAGEKYRVGERLVLFLYPASRLGLTSTVAGQRGRFTLDGRGQVLLGMERRALLDDLRLRSGRLREDRDRIGLRDFLRGVRLARPEEE